MMHSLLDSVLVFCGCANSVLQHCASLFTSFHCLASNVLFHYILYDNENYNMLGNVFAFYITFCGSTE